MFENLAQLAEKGGVWAGLALMGLAILRAIGLRASKDAITIKADGADRDAFNRLMQRVNHLDGRVNELEATRNHLFGFVTQCMAYISQCQCNGTNPPTRADLHRFYQELLVRLNAHFNKEG
jgi:hypothetical protein